MAAEFVVDAGLTAIVLNYRNKLLIGDEILPRVQVGTKAFEYTTMLASQNITLIDTNVGRRSKPNEIDMTGQSATAKCEDQALDAPVPYNDIEEYNSGVARGLVAPRDIDGAKAAQVQNIIDLRREKRVADTVYAAASYPAGNKVTLSGTSQWSDYTNSDPLAAMLAALDAMYWRPNSLVMGNDVWAKLRVHPKLSAALYPSGGNASVATAPLQDTSGLAAVLGLQNIWIGQSFLNTAKPGQAVSNARVWGKHALFFTKDDSIRTTDGGVTLGITAQFGGRVSGRIMDPDMGMRGGYRVRAGECLKEVLVAPDTAYLFTNAVA